MKRIIGSLSLVVAASFVTPLQAQQQLDVLSFVALAARGTNTAMACANTAASIVALKVPGWILRIRLLPDDQPVPPIRFWDAGVVVCTARKT